MTRLHTGVISLAVAILALDLATELGVAGGVPFVVPVAASSFGRSRRWTIGVAVAVTGLTLLGYLLAPSGGELWKVLLNRSYAVFAIWAVAFFAVKHMRLEDALGTLAEDRRQLTRRLLTAYEDERRRIVSDLHDGPAQQLAGAGMVLTAYRTSRAGPEEEQAERQLTDTLDILSGALDETRRIMAGLSPVLLDDLGLAEALRAACREAAGRLNIEWTMLGTPPTRELAPEVEIAIFRIAQEALNNAVRHSSTKSLECTFDDGPEGILLEIRDQGRGFDPVLMGHGLGIVGMRERAGLIGGTLEIQSEPGMGSVVRLRVLLV